VNQLLKRLVQEICRRASVRAAHREVRSYSTLGVKFPRSTHPYIPMSRGFCYLVAIMDWASRMVLSWRLSNTLDSAFCTDALEEAIEKYGCPDIFNTDQGSQFTAEAFTNILRSNSIGISMDGKGRWRDNVFIERLWKSVKYEDIYLKAYASMAKVKNGLASYFKFYNEKRWHNNFDRKTPAMIYFSTQSQKQAAA